MLPSVRHLRSLVKKSHLPSSLDGQCQVKDSKSLSQKAIVLNWWRNFSVDSEGRLQGVSTLPITPLHVVMCQSASGGNIFQTHYT